MYLINKLLLAISFIILINCKSNNDNKENRTKIKTNEDLNKNNNIIKEVGKNKIEIKNSIEDIENEDQNKLEQNKIDQNQNDLNFQNIPNYNQFNQNIPNIYQNPQFLNNQMNNQLAKKQFPNNQFYNNQCPYFNNNLMPQNGYMYNNFPLQNHINTNQNKMFSMQDPNNMQYELNNSGINNDNKNIVDQSKTKNKTDHSKKINKSKQSKDIDASQKSNNTQNKTDIEKNNSKSELDGSVDKSSDLPKDDGKIVSTDKKAGELSEDDEDEENSDNDEEGEQSPNDEIDENSNENKEIDKQEEKEDKSLDSEEEIQNNNANNKKKKSKKAKKRNPKKNTEYKYKYSDRLLKGLKKILDEIIEDKILKQELPNEAITFRRALYNIASKGTMEAAIALSTLVIFLNEKENSPKSSLLTSKDVHAKAMGRWNKHDKKINNDFEKEYEKFMLAQKNENVKLDTKLESKQALQKIIGDRETLIKLLELEKPNKKKNLAKQYLSIADTSSQILVRAILLKKIFIENDEILREYKEMIIPSIKRVINYDNKTIKEKMKNKLTKSQKSKTHIKYENKLEKRLTLLKKLIKLK
ncbi:MAG: hypothetical protein GY830_03050 [Bacteroidetes bacterium]|nr:hypothetical protein [Bacteroidota bacterium]